MQTKINKKANAGILAWLFNPQVWVFIAVILIIYFGFVYTGSFISEASYSTSKEYSYKGVDLIAKSTSPFGVVSESDSYGGSNKETNDVNNFQISLSGLSIPGSGVCNPPKQFSSKNSFILSKNLNISTETLNSITIKGASGSSCGAGKCTCTPGSMKIYLVNSNGDVYEAYTWNSQTTNFDLTIDKSGNDFYATSNNIKKSINLPSGNYELLFYAGMPGGVSCGCAGMSAESNLRIDEFTIDSVPIDSYVVAEQSTESNKIASDTIITKIQSQLSTESVSNVFDRFSSWIKGVIDRIFNLF
jgi:hypothetical protein